MKTAPIWRVGDPLLCCIVPHVRLVRGGGEPPPLPPPPRAIPTTVHCPGSPGESVVFMCTIASRERLAIRIRTRKR